MNNCPKCKELIELFRNPKMEMTKELVTTCPICGKELKLAGTTNIDKAKTLLSRALLAKMSGNIKLYCRQALELLEKKEK